MYIDVCTTAMAYRTVCVQVTKTDVLGDTKQIAVVLTNERNRGRVE